ncbi:hypothetical protein DPMN_035150 [Dreissena polymorpha]|uniref:Uncharacterized protein n=1 Tax=Dreissena polymorpha TaxID=45954 RepID=A0A9D4RMP7_DREPO|nr:hypothetical protein DPMN_035150 [Dreissena polymorpha]
MFSSILPCNIKTVLLTETLECYLMCSTALFLTDTVYHYSDLCFHPLGAITPSLFLNPVNVKSPSLLTLLISFFAPDRLI